MEAEFKFGDHIFAGVRARNPDALHGRFRAGVTKQDFAGTRCALDEFLSESDLKFMRCSVNGASFQLSLQRFNNEWRAMAKEQCAIGHAAIDVAVPIDVPDITTICLLGVKGVGLKDSCATRKSAREDRLCLLPSLS